MNLEVLVVCASLAGVVFYCKRPHEVEKVGTGIAGIIYIFIHHNMIERTEQKVQQKSTCRQLLSFQTPFFIKTCTVRASDFGSSFVMLSVLGVIYYCISQS